MEDNRSLKEVFEDLLTYLESSEGSPFSNVLNKMLQYMYKDNLLTLGTVEYLRKMLQLPWKFLESNPDGTQSCFKEYTIMDVVEPLKLAIFIVTAILQDKQFATLVEVKDFDSFMNLLEKSHWNEEEIKICESTAALVKKPVYMDDYVYYQEGSAIYYLPQKGFHLLHRVNKKKLYHDGIKEIIKGDPEGHRIYALSAEEEGYVCLYVKEHKIRKMRNALFLGIDSQGREWLYSDVNKTVCSYYMGKLKAEFKKTGYDISLLPNDKLLFLPKKEPAYAGRKPYIKDIETGKIEDNTGLCKEYLWHSYLDEMVEKAKPGEITKAIRIQELYQPPTPFSIKAIQEKLRVFEDMLGTENNFLALLCKLERQGVNPRMDISDLLYEKLKEASAKGLNNYYEIWHNIAS